MDALGISSSIAVIDDFRVSGLPFSPHPHAGFAAVTYVFEDSRGAVRSRASTGVDLTIGPGGIVWSEAGRGVVHEEVPADQGVQLHGLQLFVNLSASHKTGDPRVLSLRGDEVPEWLGEEGTRVRVVVGAFQGVPSPLVPIEPFTFLDIHLSSEVSIDLLPENVTAIYVLQGSATARLREGQYVDLGSQQAVAVRGGAGALTLNATSPATQLLLLSCREVSEPVVADGPFIMNSREQVAAAVTRFRSGEMGHLAPLH
ncbi:MAG TPA: pirin family protein [Actinomycetes bacterium]|nr:pirin family protein [Actinomycetes bacterium]